MASFNIFINDKEYLAHEGETVLNVATRNNIFIPALCYHCDLMPHESCRMCMVEVEGDKNLRASCSLRVKEDMSVFTDTERTLRALKTNLELTWSQHEGKCKDCVKKNDCKLYDLAQRYVFDKKKYSDRKNRKGKYQFGPAIVFEPEKCINCENCKEMCARQTQGGFLGTSEGKFNFEISPSEKAELDCIFCGQCIVHCPTGALHEKEDWQEILKMIRGGKKVVFQFAPSVRTSLGEEFGMEAGTNVTDKIFSALKMLRVYASFDTSFGADITIMEEAEECLERIKKAIKEGKEPEAMFTSCCPAWVKYVEFYEPDFIPNLTTVRSPQIILGGVLKKYWAKKENINPRDIVSVSVMPCTSKKFEVTREELKLNGMAPVDYSITVREFAKMLKEENIDLSKIEAEARAENLLSDPTGGGEIFGASGGVMEAALRTAYFMLTGNNLEEVEFHQLHEQKGIKKFELKIGDINMRLAAVNGIENAKVILEELKKNPRAYAYVEVMACPGGCIGGGGQPIPVDDEIRQKRAEGLYASDRDRTLRLCHESPGIKKIYKEFLNTKKVREEICKTKFGRKKKSVVKKVNNK